MLIPIGLYLVGVAGIIIEFFVPTAGILGIFGGGVIIWSVIKVYRDFGTLYGLVFMAMVIITAPGMIFFYFKVFPRSFMGKRLILQERQSTNSGYSSIPERMSPAVGEEGICVSSLRPSGTVLFPNGKYSAVTIGEFIEHGTAVIVTKVEGNRIVVRTNSTLDAPKEENP